MVITKEITEEDIVCASVDQVSTEVSGEAVILNLEDGTYYGLNLVGARVWNLLKSPISVREIEEALLEEYDVAQEVCHRELMALLGELASYGLIEVSNE